MVVSLGRSDGHRSRDATPAAYRQPVWRARDGLRRRRAAAPPSTATSRGPRPASCCCASRRAASAAPTCTCSTARSRSRHRRGSSAIRSSGSPSPAAALRRAVARLDLRRVPLLPRRAREPLRARALHRPRRHRGFAEYAVADERFCFEVPGDEPPEQIAPLLCAELIALAPRVPVRTRVTTHPLERANDALADCARGASPAPRSSCRNTRLPRGRTVLRPPAARPPRGRGDRAAGRAARSRPGPRGCRRPAPARPGSAGRAARSPVVVRRRRCVSSAKLMVIALLGRRAFPVGVPAGTPATLVATVAAVKQLPVDGRAKPGRPNEGLCDGREAWRSWSSLPRGGRAASVGTQRRVALRGRQHEARRRRE